MSSRAYLALSAMGLAGTIDADDLICAVCEIHPELDEATGPLKNDEELERVIDSAAWLSALRILHPSVLLTVEQVKGLLRTGLPLRLAVCDVIPDVHRWHLRERVTELKAVGWAAAGGRQ